MFYLLADEIEPLLECVIGEMRLSSDENLLDIGACPQGFFADSGDVHGDFAPSEEGCAVFLEYLFNACAGEFAGIPICAWEEEHADTQVCY